MLAISSKNMSVALRIIASDSVDVSAVVEVSVSSGDSVDLNWFYLLNLYVWHDCVYRADRQHFTRQPAEDS